MNFWDFMSFLFWSYIFISYLMIIFGIIGDIFRDDTLNGWLKALWIIFLVFVPFLTALVYIVARGTGMRDRQYGAMQQARYQTDDYIRSVASSPVDEITKAKTLLDSGSISQAEFDGLKARALSGSPYPTAV